MISGRQYGWVIDRDFITPASDKSMVGTYGPRISGTNPEISDRFDRGEGDRFRMYDGDGNIYVEGRYIGPDDETQFAPKDDWGEPSLGCTEIRYFQDGKGWVTL